jgi:hypothetical protein
MPASLTASPNPVRVWDESEPQSTTITWNTGSTVRGRVYLTVSDGTKITAPEGVFDDNPANGNHSKPLPVKLGSIYSLVLRQVSNNARLAPILIVRVTDAREHVIAMAAASAALSKKINTMQAIYNLRVSAGIDTCRVRGCLQGWVAGQHGQPTRSGERRPDFRRRLPFSFPLAYILIQELLCPIVKIPSNRAQQMRATQENQSRKTANSSLS